VYKAAERLLPLLPNQGALFHIWSDERVSLLFHDTLPKTPLKG